MKINQIVSTINGKIVCGAEQSDVDIVAACASDMMSDVLAYAGNQGVLITGLTNPQVVRTAVMMDINCIIFVRGKKPDATMVQLANDSNIVFVTTDLNMFESVGKLYAAGLRA